MTDKTKSINSSRRQFVISSGGAIGVAALAGVLSSRAAQAADLPHVGANDPQAVAFSYTEDAKTSKHAKYVAGSECLNCDFYQARGTTAPYGPCMIFPGKAVNSHGWCMNYVKVK